MRFIALLVVFIFITTVVYTFTKAKKQYKQIDVSVQTSQKNKNNFLEYNKKKFLFIPDWTKQMQSTLSENTNCIFFSSKQLSLEEKYPASFINGCSKTTRYITLSITDKQYAEDIMKDTSKQTSLIYDYVNFIKNNNIEGIVLDIELYPTLLQPYTNEFTLFTTRLYKDLLAVNKKLYVVVYGDTYQKSRPYDIEALAKVSDGIMIMIYDLYRSNTDVGPSFPLFGKDIYGYDIEELFKRVKKDVTEDKIIPIYGAYGYTWIVDKNDNPIKRGKAVSINELNKMLKECKQNCITYTDNIVHTTIIKNTTKDDVQITYADSLEQIKEKISYAASQQIYHIGIFAYGYGADVILE